MIIQTLSIWVVTVNWNQPEYTRECIEKLRRRNNIQFQVVVVDNGSSDNSIKILEEIKSVNLIQKEKNLGFSGGFNTGIKFAEEHSPDFIFMVNNDTLSGFNMLDIMVTNALKLNAEISAPAIFYSINPEKLWSAGGDINRFLCAPINSHNPKKPLPSQPVRREFLTGCALLIKNDVFEKIGYFDEDYFLYYEDLDFFKRALDAKLSVWLIPSAKMYHHVSGSLNNIDDSIQHYWMGNSSWRYFLKHTKPWQWVFVIPWRTGHLIKKIITLMIRGNHSSAKTYIKGIFDTVKEQFS